MEKYKFSNTVAREDLNPHNIKIGNEFENNLLLTGKKLFTDSLTDLDCKVTTGILPLDKIDAPDIHNKKFCKGLAVEFSVDRFVRWDYSKLAEYLFFKYDDLHIIIDDEKDSIYVGRKFRSNVLYERTNKGILRKL